MEKVLRCENCAGPRRPDDNKCSYCDYSFASLISETTMASVLDEPVPVDPAKLGRFFVGYQESDVRIDALKGLCFIMGLIGMMIFFEAGGPQVILRYFGLWN